MKKISVVVPVYNEQAFVANCLASIKGFTVPDGWAISEVLIVDGGSTDATCEIVSRAMASDQRIAIVRNPRRIQATALNVAIESAVGDYILRLDAHASYPPDYLEKCVEAVVLTHADNVGGVVVTMPGGDGYGASLVQALTTHKFGVGDSGFRLGERGGKADTVPFGFFRRDIFRKVGFFDERLVRGEDYELNRRIALTGGVVWRDPAIRATYFNKANLWSFLKKQAASEAPYNAYMWYLAPYAFAWRHSIAAIFVVGLFWGVIFWPWGLIRAIYLSVLFLYLFMAIVSSVQQALKYRDWRHVFCLPFCFFLYHSLYGAGVLYGLLKIATRTAPVQKDRGPWKGADKFLVADILQPHPGHIGLTLKDHGDIDGLKNGCGPKAQTAECKAEKMSRKCVSIVIPAKNEENTIIKCIASVQTFRVPAGWTIAEILVLDGGGQDTALAVLKKTIQRNRITVIPNVKKIQSAGLNIAIARATGSFILRLDAHSTYPADYLEKCVQAWLYTRADNVGGVVVTTPKDGAYGAAIIQALTTHRFGVGNSWFRLDAKAGPADTVPYGFFRKTVFSRVGVFDERLIRAQDYEMNRRIGAAGGFIWCDPKIRVEYVNQSSLLGFLIKQVNKEAPYNTYMWYLAPYTFAWRHGITGVFAIGVIAGAGLWCFSQVRNLYLLVIGVYLFLAVLSSIQQSLKYRKLPHVFVLPFCFFAYHFAHGLGVLYGLIDLALGVAPVQKVAEPWAGAGQPNAWPPPNGKSWCMDYLRMPQEYSHV